MKTKKTNIIKKQGTKTLAGILAVGMTFGTPVSVLADDNTPDSTMEQQAGVQNVLAKKVDGSETLVKVSEVVLGMIQRNEVKLDTDKFLKDVTTGQKDRSDNRRTSNRTGNTRRTEQTGNTDNTDRTE